MQVLYHRAHLLHSSRETEVLDVSVNELTGKVPSVLADLSSLCTLCGVSLFLLFLYLTKVPH